MRSINPVNWKLATSSGSRDDSSPLVTLVNAQGHKLHVHPIADDLVRVVHALPPGLRMAGMRGRYDEAGIRWERRRKSQQWSVEQKTALIVIRSPSNIATGGGLRIEIDYQYATKLSWFWDDPTASAATEEANGPFLRDFKHAYQYDAASGRVYHFTCREPYMPLSEHAKPANETHPAQPGQTEFLYGLGETRGPMMKVGKSYLIDGRDSLAADPHDTSPLYKLCPFYTTYHAPSKRWHGLYYNTLAPSSFDFGEEHDFSTGNFRSFTTECGPLDYYVLLRGHEWEAHRAEQAIPPPSLPGVIEQFGELVTPFSSSSIGRPLHDEHEPLLWQASPCLPHLSQFGYLASSLTLSERQDAQNALLEYVRSARQLGFPIDGMHLSSGYCQEPTTGDRQYFIWPDANKYPNPNKLGTEMEQELTCKAIVNVKPWLLETHPWYTSSANKKIFVGAAPDTLPADNNGEPVDADRCGSQGQARTMHWSVNMGETGKGSYIDFSSQAGYTEWQKFMHVGVLKKNMTGLWIDNNEFSTLNDDLMTLRGEVDMWSAMDTPAWREQELAREVSARMGWLGKASAGSVGRASLTMGMAKATFDALKMAQPELRPLIVTRSFVPGMAAFAHASWSGDNSTQWASLKWSTKLTLSVGLSGGPGLYGHDVGGFAGALSPSAELLIRWCQHSMWHTRFTVHSWKAISTTLWMYDDQEGVTDTLRNIVSFHYSLLPTLYSTYVFHYHQHCWPVLKPLLWYHSADRTTLTQDDQFIVGSHILIAPVVDFGARSVEFNLPNVVDGSGDPPWWCELDSGAWIPPAEDEGLTGRTMTMEAPLSRCPALVRDGGILVTAPAPKSPQLSAFNSHSRSDRIVQIFPAPRTAMRSSSGSFTLVEDDGHSNRATELGAVTMIDLAFNTEAAADVIYVSVRVDRSGFAGQWIIDFILPLDDDREMAVKPSTLLGNGEAVPFVQTLLPPAVKDSSGRRITRFRVAI